jgi:hypothetical protein
LFLCALAIAGDPATQEFGRFGYVERVEIPHFDVNLKGFRIQNDRADTFYFESASRRWRPVQTTAFEQTVVLSGIGRSPEKVRFDLGGSGFQMFFRHGLSFRLTSTQAPYLTWSEGSVGPGVPTPASPWILVSFRDAQPPLLISFLGSPSALTVSGKPGDWRLAAAEGFQGWVRFAAPLGLEGYTTNSAAALGGLKAKCKPLLKYLTGPVPKLLSVETKDEPTGVTATWTFDRPYALLPVPALLANLGGYPLKLQSSSFRIDSTDPSGPLSVAQESIVRIRFPVRRIPTGRALSVGSPKADPIGTVSPLDVPSVAELALSNLLACRDDLTKESAEAALSRYLSDVSYGIEPSTNQRLPYQPDGIGLDLAAAHALLMQSTISTVKATSEPNSLLTSVLWRRDWRTWTIWSPSPLMTRRAGALAALAASICPEPERRLDAGMLEAGLAAIEGLRVWRTRVGMPAGQKPGSAPFEGLRRSMFGYTSRPDADEAFLKSLLSEIRIYGDHSVRAESRDGEILLRWFAEDLKPTMIVLASAYPISSRPGTNLETVLAEEALGFTLLRCAPKERGMCEVRLKAPEWAEPLPTFAEPSRFSAS